MVGRVKYSDYATDAMPMHNLFTPFMRNRRSFAFENELRLLYWNSDLMSPDTDTTDEFPPGGIGDPAAIPALIETVDHVTRLMNSGIRRADGGLPSTIY